jgi:RHS repeat-associated protein
VITVPKSGPFQTRQAAKRPLAATTQAAGAAGPLFPGGQPLGWHGHWTDPVTGFIYMKHRWYDPRSGTFLSPDPMEDLDSPNLYLFGAGRPHEVLDPLGLCLGLDKEGRPCGYYADRIDDYLVAGARLRGDRTGVPLAIDRTLLAPLTGLLRLGEAQGRLGYRYVEALTNPMVVLPPGATVASETNALGLDLLQAAGDAALLAPLARGGSSLPRGALQEALAGASRPTKSIPGIFENKVAGDTVRDAIAGREAPALIEQEFKTLGGARRIDVLKIVDDLSVLRINAETVAIESKVGRTALTPRVRQELARDWWLLRQGKVNKVVWEFSPSDVTGEVGPTRPLQEMIDKLGFESRINGKVP